MNLIQYVKQLGSPALSCHRRQIKDVRERSHCENDSQSALDREEGDCMISDQCRMFRVQEKNIEVGKCLVLKAHRPGHVLEE